MNLTRSLFAVATMTFACASVACGAAPREDDAAETSDALTANESLLRTVAEELDPELPRGAGVYEVDGVELTLVAVPLAELDTRWSARIDRVRADLETGDDPERMNRYADLLDVYRIERAGRFVGLTANIGTYEAWNECEDDCSRVEHTAGKRVYFTSRKKEVVRVDWEL